MCFWTEAPREASSDAFDAMLPYAEIPDSIDVQMTEWDDEGAQDLLAKLRAGAAFAELDPALTERIVRGPRVVGLDVTVTDASDFGYLQVVWAWVVQMVHEGAVVVKDRQSWRWWLAESVMALDPDRPFLPSRELGFVQEREGDEVHHFTRGMTKLGLPELVLPYGADENSIAWAAYWLARAAELGVEGEPLAAGDEHFIEGIWLQIVENASEAGRPVTRVLEIASRSAIELLAVRGVVPEWFADVTPLRDQAPFAVTDRELRSLLPFNASDAVIAVTTSEAPRDCVERLRSVLGAKNFELLETRRLGPDAQLAMFSHAEADAGLTVVATRADSLPATVRGGDLPARVGPARTLVLVTCAGSI